MNRSAVALGLVCVMTAPRSVFAQSASGPAESTSSHAESPSPALAPLSESLTGAAKTAFASAQVLLHNGDLAGAFAKLRQAYDESKDPRLLFNMAICARDLHDYARMRTLLVRYQREGQAVMLADEPEQVEAALNAIRDLVGAVHLVVSEAGATVALDGETIGTTPLDDAIILNLGKHELTVAKRGFERTQETVDTAGGSVTTLTVTLRAQAEAPPAHLVVASDDNATVVIDGKNAARGRFDRALRPGVHEVSVTAPGRVAYKAQVDLRDGETRSVQVTLEPEKHAEAWWAWVTGGVAVVAGLAVGGYFLLKPGLVQSSLTGEYATVKFN
ncbi:MAG: PEGA domain-containing protein [Polyangiaceae bacterium]